MYARNITNANDEEKAAIESKKRRIQMEILIIESDIRKLNTDKFSTDNNLRQLARDDERIRIELDSKKRYLTKLLQDIQSKEEELHTLRKKLNLL